MSSLPLSSFCSPRFNLQTFVRSPQLPNSFYILNSFYPQFEADVYTDDLPAARTPFIKVYDIYDYYGDICGNLIRHRPMTNVIQGAYYLNFSRALEEGDIAIQTWTGSFIKLIEGDNGCLIVNTCSRTTPASKRLEMI